MNDEHPDPWPMVSSECEVCGREFCNHGGKCYACDRIASAGEDGGQA